MSALSHKFQQALWSFTQQRRFVFTLLAIAAVGVAVRVVYVLVLAPRVPGIDPAWIGDTGFYQRSAKLLADGHGFIQPFVYLNLGQSVPTAEHPPLWPALLSLPTAIGLDGLQTYRLVGCLLGAPVILLLGLFAGKVFGRLCGLIAATIAAFYPVLIGADGSLMSETLYGLLALCGLLCAALLLDSGAAKWALLAGLALGLAALTRGEGSLLILLVPLALMLVGGRRQVKLSLVTGLVALLVVAPWLGRNWDRFGKPTPVSINYSTVLAGANCPPTYSDGDLGFWRLDCLPWRSDLNEANQSRALFEQGWDYVNQHKKRLIFPVIPARLLRTWSLYEPIEMAKTAEGRAPKLEQAGTFVFYLLALLALYGAVVLYRRSGLRSDLLLLLVPFLVVNFVTVTGFGWPRFRHLAELSIVILAAVAVSSLLSRWSIFRFPERLGS